MVYHVTRGGQSYGPYTLADLQRYVASGHVLLSDLAKSDEMAEWVPVSQILSPSGLPPAAPPIYAAQPGFVPQEYAAPGGVPLTAYPDPPKLHWGLVLLFGVLTCGLFIVVWELVQAAWLRKIAPQSKALILYAVGDIAYLFVFSNGFMSSFNHSGSRTGAGIALTQLVYVVLNIWARFNFKASLEEHFNSVEPIGLEMSGVMTFFFGSLYIQSQLTRISEIRQGIRYRGIGQ